MTNNVAARPVDVRVLPAREVRRCSECIHRSPGFMSEPATCVWGDRAQNPYDWLCDDNGIPEHCPLPVLQ